VVSLRTRNLEAALAMATAMAISLNDRNLEAALVMATAISLRLSSDDGDLVKIAQPRTMILLGLGRYNDDGDLVKIGNHNKLSLKDFRSIFYHFQSSFGGDEGPKVVTVSSRSS